MLEKPFIAMAVIAQKFQSVATRVAAAAARVAQSAARSGAKMAQTAAKIQARGDARYMARAIRRIQGRPKVQFVRELRRGQTSFKFYRATDRAGKVSDYWTLTRDTPRGRVRLAMGTMDEFRNLRTIVSHTVRSDVQGRHQVARSQAAHPEPRRAQEQRTPQEPRKTRVMKGQEEIAATRWYTLIHVERINSDGTARARVVKSYPELDQAQEARSKNPKLALHRHTYTTPPRRGDIVTVKAGDSPEVKARIEELRQQGAHLNGHDRTPAADRRAKTPELERQRQLTHER